MRKLLAAFVGMLVTVAPAAAQDKPVDVNFGFGWAFPTADFKQSFNAGWNGTIGATFNFSPHLGFEAEYMYTRMTGPEKQILLSATPVAAQLTNGLIESNHQMHVGSFNLVYKTTNAERPFGGYLIGGGGIYHRIVQLTSPSVGYTTVCDPYGTCVIRRQSPWIKIIGDRSSNDFGIDFGGGITFGHEVHFYIESRYHYVWGKTITPTASTLPSGTAATTCSGGCTTNAAYFPLTFGIRW